MQVSDSSWTLRASALATIAEIVTSLGQAVLPTLPRMVPIILSAAAAAIEQLPSPAEAADKDVDMNSTETKVPARSASFRYIVTFVLFIKLPVLDHFALFPSQFLAE